MTAAYEKHSDVPAEYIWRLTDIYPGEDAWESALSDVQKKAEELASYQGKLAESASVLRAALLLFEELEKELERVYMYAS